MFCASIRQVWQSVSSESIQRSSAVVVKCGAAVANLTWTVVWTNRLSARYTYIHCFERFDVFVIKLVIITLFIMLFSEFITFTYLDFLVFPIFRDFRILYLSFFRFCAMWKLMNKCVRRTRVVNEYACIYIWKVGLLCAFCLKCLESNLADVWNICILASVRELGSQCLERSADQN